MVRTTLLALSRNRWLGDRLPRYRFARAAVRRFMPGERLDDALDATARLRTAGLGAVLTCLGENVGDEAAAGAAARHYHEALETIAARGADARLSIKLTQLGLDLDDDLAAGHLDALAAAAARSGNQVWVDMEDSSYVDRTLAIFRDATAAHGNVGLCLQAYLHRTPADLKSLLETTAAIRLVKGAYREPHDVALQRERDVDAAFHRLAVRLLRAAAAHADRPGPVLGSHDTELLARVAADTPDVPRGAYEIQMLYGIRPDEQRRLAGDGHAVRVLVSYGDAWFPWFMRRLAERPANLWFVARNLATSRP